MSRAESPAAHRAAGRFESIARGRTGHRHRQSSRFYGRRDGRRHSRRRPSARTGSQEVDSGRSSPCSRQFGRAFGGRFRNRGRREHYGRGTARARCAQQRSNSAPVRQPTLSPRCHSKARSGSHRGKRTARADDSRTRTRRRCEPSFAASG